ncbi:MAG: hypothetical protein ACTHOG_08385 [Marmoricola sp.]
MSKTLIGMGIGAVVAVVATLSGVALAQPASHHVSQSQVYSYSDN